MKRRLPILCLLLFLGACINVAITLLIAQFSEKPPCSLAFAQNYATRKIFSEPNPTPPIWPAFSVRSWCVSIDGVNPEESPASSSSSSSSRLDADGFIIITIRVGWPLRCLATRTQYISGGWTKPASALQLAARPDKANRPLPRELPLNVMWLGFLLNSMLFAAAVVLPFGCVAISRRMWRRLKRRCPACGYPIGQSPVCTECGVRVNTNP